MLSLQSIYMIWHKVFAGLHSPWVIHLLLEVLKIAQQHLLYQQMRIAICRTRSNPYLKHKKDREYHVAVPLVVQMKRFEWSAAIASGSSAYSRRVCNAAFRHSHQTRPEKWVTRDSIAAFGYVMGVIPFSAERQLLSHVDTDTDKGIVDWRGGDLQNI